MSKNRFIMPIACLCVVVFPLLCWAQASFRITPPVIELTLARGGVKVVTFDLSNEDKEKGMEFKIFPMDIDVSRQGDVNFHEMGASSMSCTSWVELEPKVLTLDPAQTKRVTVKISVPGSITAGGYYGAIMCEMLNKKTTMPVSGAKITWRIATLLKITVTGSGLQKKVVFDDFKLQTIADPEQPPVKGLMFVASLRNSGNVHVPAEGKLTVLSVERYRKGEVDFDVGTGTVLPDHTRDFAAVYDKPLAEGDYIARAVFKYGGASALEQEIPFSVRSSTGKPGDEPGTSVTIEAMKLNPETISMVMPKGAFRTSGFSIQNQRRETTDVTITRETGVPPGAWLTCEPQHITLQSGAEGKVFLQFQVPRDAKEGDYKGSVHINAEIVGDSGTKERLEQRDVLLQIKVPQY